MWKYDDSVWRGGLSQVQYEEERKKKLKDCNAYSEAVHVWKSVNVK